MKIQHAHEQISGNLEVTAQNHRTVNNGITTQSNRLVTLTADFDEAGMIRV